MKVTGFESDYHVATLRRTLGCEQALALEKWALVGKGLMVQRPFDSWESRFVKVWTICNLQHEHDMTVTVYDWHDPRKAILSLVFFTKTKLSIAFGRLGYIYMWYNVYIYIHRIHVRIPFSLMVLLFFVLFVHVSIGMNFSCCSSIGPHHPQLEVSSPLGIHDMILWYYPLVMKIA